MLILGSQMLLDALQSVVHSLVLKELILLIYLVIYFMICSNQFVVLQED